MPLLFGGLRLMESGRPLPIASTSPATPRLRLEFLDGLRGLAALYVVLFHAFQLTTTDHPRVDAALAWRIGHSAVSVFIVLSGFCLTLPIVRSGSRELRGGVRAYLKRRAWRILPPYYAALVLSALLLAGAHLATYRTAAALHDQVLGRHLSPGSLLSHLFLVHNLSIVWVETIDPPMWSVATEWQIYFFLPALLLPVWRRFGGLAALAVGFAVGLLPHYLLPPGRNLDAACPWYLGLFTLGMGGAILAFSPRPRVAWWGRLPWGVLAGTLFLLFGVFITRVPYAWTGRYTWQADTLAGAAAVCLILWGISLVTRPHTPRPAALRALEARPTLWLGSFSYSLYLVHYPILNKAAQLLAAWRLPYGERLALIYAAGVPLALALAYLFHLAFEKRFIARPASAQSAQIVLR